MDIVVLGPKGGDVKIIKDNGSGFQMSFLNLTYVKRPSAQVLKKFKKELIES